MYCPKCNSEMWDNRGRKKNPKQPDYACKNQECRFAVWEKPKSSPANTEQVNPVQSNDIKLIELAVMMACNPSANINSVADKFNTLKNILSGKTTAQKPNLPDDFSDVEVPF